MRFFVLALFLGAPLFAQTPPPPDRTPKPETPAAPPPPGTADAVQQPEITPLPPELNLRFPNLQNALKNSQKGWDRYFALPPAKAAVQEKSALAPGQPCAIPLVNVLRSVPHDRMLIPAVPSARSTTPEVRLPAPSCDDVKR